MSTMKCDLHDYLEIACLFHYRVRIKLKSGSELTGLPVSTITEGGQKEWLLFREEKIRLIESKIDLDDLLSMSVLDEKARFRHVDF